VCPDGRSAQAGAGAYDGVLAFKRQGAGRPLVMLNGFAATKDDWDPTLLAALGEMSELVLADHRGVGGSAGFEGGFSIEDMALDAAGLIEALGLDRPPVLGWSMGGFVALALTLARPDLVGRLILLSTSPGGDAATPASPGARERLHDFSGTPADQASRLISLLFAPARAVEVEAEFGEVVAAARAEFPAEVAAAQWDAMEAWEEKGADDRLHQIACPTLVATGTEDVVIPPANALALATAIPGAWLARFRDSGHAFMADHPRSLAKLIGAFLDAKA
jgi:pimeloyl-ACP methyl ester carboxylesterase